MKCLVRDFPLIPAIHQNGMKGPVEIFPVGDAHGLDGLYGFDDLAGTDRQSCLPKNAAKMHDVGRKTPA